MSTVQNHRRAHASLPSSSLVKRQATVAESQRKAAKFAAPQQPKKRQPLTNLTNLNNQTRNAPRVVQCSTKIAKAKKESSVCSHYKTSISENTLSVSSNSKPSNAITHKDAACIRKEEAAPSAIRKEEAAPSAIAIPPPCSIEVSPSRSVSVSLDETMSTCDSFKSPEVEYLDSNDDSPVVSIERKAFSNLCISEYVEQAGNACEDVGSRMETDAKVVNVDNNFSDPQFCATIACDIYNHLRASEMKKRPSTNFMEEIQKDINPSMRAILIDWLVEVAEEYRLIPDTLYLTVNYIDRYLSGNPMDRQRLQLLGVACMMIASKYEEICAPQVEEFCYITDNTYFKDEVLQMESAVLNYLKFEMTAPTVKCFLRRFARAAHGTDEAPSLPLECLANYLAELSLVEYNMLCYSPSIIAASSIFLAKYMLTPSKKPWNTTLQHYTLYRPTDLRECVEALHQLCCNSHHSTLPAVREKYSQHKYKFVAKKHCPASIPPEFFHSLSS